MKGKIYFVQVKSDAEILEGYLIFIQSLADFYLINPHEIIIEEKLKHLAYEIEIDANLQSPLLCLTDELQVIKSNTLSNNFSYYDNNHFFSVAYENIPQPTLSKALLLADGHHRRAALLDPAIFNLVRPVPIFNYSSLFKSRAICSLPIISRNQIGGH